MIFDWNRYRHSRAAGSASGFATRAWHPSQGDGQGRSRGNGQGKRP